MPVILPTLQDPTDRVINGEQMRASVLDLAVSTQAQIASVSKTSGFSSLVQDEDAYAPMNSFIDGNRLSMRRAKDGVLQMRSGAGIATPCGAWIYQDFSPLLNPLLWATERWAIIGVTYDETDTPLPGCRVVAFETGRIEMGEGESEVGETISDGSGVYSIPVPLNTAYQLTAYKPGSPDVAGITRNDVVPIAVG